MGIRSRLFGISGFAAALFLCLLILLATSISGSITGSMTAKSETAGVSSQDARLKQSFKLAQNYYYYPDYRAYQRYRTYPQLRRKKRRKPRTSATKKCTFPWLYSRGLRKCICVSEGYGVSGGRCVKIAEMCSENALWSDVDKQCVCQKGFVEKDSRCIDPDAAIVTYNPADGSQCLWPRVKSSEGKGCDCAQGYAEQAGQCVLSNEAQSTARRRASADELLTKDILVIQQCLREAGYQRSKATGRMDKKSWTAFWLFKQDYAIGRTPKGVNDVKSQHRMFTLCPKTSLQLAAMSSLSGKAKQGPAAKAPAPGASVTAKLLSVPKSSSPVPVITPAPEVKAPLKRVYARPEAGCLPDDLHKLIVATYGDRPKLKRCSQICIPRPANISPQEVRDYESKRGVTWCRSCIELSSQIPLDDILRIERGANVQICTRPPSRLPRWTAQGAARRPGYTKVRALYRKFPRAIEHASTIAVVIGNGTYKNALPGNASALASAGAMYTLLNEHLGFDQENVIDLRDAASEDFNRVFGSAEDHRGDLWRRLQNRPDANILIYYAGHGGTRADQSDSFLIPVDAVKYREEKSGYPMSLLYANLAKLKAKSILLLLETGFGRDLSEYVFPPNLPEMQVSVLPVQPVPGLSVLTASDRDQKTLDDQKYGIGLFTRYLIEGLAGRADLAPIGNGDRKIDTVELYAYTSHMVRLAARKSFGLLQKPLISRDGNARLSQVQAQGQ